MKKLLCLLLCLVMLPVAALASAIDLSEMSYDELIELQQELAAAIMACPEWKEVTVPTGLWTVGEDIPAGAYSVTAIESIYIAVWGSIKDDYSTDGGLIANEAIFDGGTLGKVILEEGNIVELSGDAVFAPPVLLGF